MISALMELERPCGTVQICSKMCNTAFEQTKAWTPVRRHRLPNATFQLYLHGLHTDFTKG